MLIARHFTTLSDGVPEWLHLMPAGTFKGVDGRGPYALKDAHAVIAASMADGPLAVDENHSTDYAAPAGLPSPAQGWIVAMEARDDGIWGRVEWNASGAALMTERAYRGVSPVFTHTKGGQVVKILRAALTNTPNLSQLETLHTQESGMNLEALRAALGLPETADEAAILAAVTANATAVASHAAQLAAIRAAGGFDPATSAEAVATALQSQRANAGDVARMAATITTLETSLATMRAEQSRRDATACIDAAIAAGKPIVALRDHYIARHMADPKAVETELNALVSINAGGVRPPAPGAHATGREAAFLTDVDKTVCSKFGTSPAKLAEFRKTRGEATANDGRAA